MPFDTITILYIHRQQCQKHIISYVNSNKKYRFLIMLWVLVIRFHLDRQKLIFFRNRTIFRFFIMYIRIYSTLICMSHPLVLRRSVYILLGTPYEISCGTIFLYFIFYTADVSLRMQCDDKFENICIIYIESRIVDIIALQWRFFLSYCSCDSTCTIIRQYYYRRDMIRIIIITIAVQ
jgi:hypothetical protein